MGWNRKNPSESRVKGLIEIAFKGNQVEALKEIFARFPEYAQSSMDSLFPSEPSAEPPAPAQGRAEVVVSHLSEKTLARQREIKEQIAVLAESDHLSKFKKTVDLLDRLTKSYELTSEEQALLGQALRRCVNREIKKPDYLKAIEILLSLVEPDSPHSELKMALLKGELNTCEDVRHFILNLKTVLQSLEGQSGYDELSPGVKSVLDLIQSFHDQVAPLLGLPVIPSVRPASGSSQSSSGETSRMRDSKQTDDSPHEEYRPLDLLDHKSEEVALAQFLDHQPLPSGVCVFSVTDESTQQPEPLGAISLAFAGAITIDFGLVRDARTLLQEVGIHRSSLCLREYPFYLHRLLENVFESADDRANPTKTLAHGKHFAILALLGSIERQFDELLRDNTVTGHREECIRQLVTSIFRILSCPDLLACCLEGVGDTRFNRLVASVAPLQDELTGSPSPAQTRFEEDLKACAARCGWHPERIQSEVSVCGRTLDIQIEEGVYVEYDGRHHFDSEGRFIESSVSDHAVLAAGASVIHRVKHAQYQRMDPFLKEALLRRLLDPQTVNTPLTQEEQARFMNTVFYETPVSPEVQITPV
jgi:hypothetical protein